MEGNRGFEAAELNEGAHGVNGGGLLHLTHASRLPT